MSFFKLTIAEDAIEKRTEAYQNQMSMLYGFIIAFAVTLVSGGWYLWIPRDINWNASQIILVLHLAGGVISLLLFLVYLPLHLKDKLQSAWSLLAPWKLRRAMDETEQRLYQRQLGHLLSWLLLMIYLSGVLIALPGLLFYFDIVWMQGYYNAQLLNSVHLWATLLMAPIILIHLLWLARK